ncbi:hypothetical protein GCM10027168_08550 [Streptomyces capparidis]
MNDARAIDIGVFLPTMGDTASPGDIAAAARLAEELGFSSVWAGDHLLGRVPVLDAGTVLTTAAAVTERVGIGFGVLHAPFHPLPWLAKRVATLQYLSGGRVLLGVGSGGTGPRGRWRGGRNGLSSWQALDLPYAERHERTDRVLELLPGLLAGGPVPGGGAGDVLEPAVAAPPLLVGGGSPRALRRAARYGDAWFPAVIAPPALAEGAARLRELAAELGRPAVPGVSVAVPLFLGEGPGVLSQETMTGTLTGVYRVPPEQAADIPLTGSPAQAAERLAAYAEAGAARIVASTGAQDWRRQYELLAEARSLLA